MVSHSYRGQNGTRVVRLHNASELFEGGKCEGGGTGHGTIEVAGAPSSRAFTLFSSHSGLGSPWSYHHPLWRLQQMARYDIGRRARSARSIIRASSTRDETSSLWKMLRRCVSIVFWLRTSSAAISGFVLRSTTKRAT
jgi:hypothetical protein